MGAESHAARREELRQDQEQMRETIGRLFEQFVDEQFPDDSAQIKSTYQIYFTDVHGVRNDIN